MAKSLPKCKHSHTIITHPNCFPKYWYEDEGHRIGYLDIEASGLSANQAWMLSWAIKDRDDTIPNYDFVRQDEFFEKPGKINLNYDKRVVKTLLDEMKNYTVLVTYYGTGFDIPFIRTRAMKYGLRFPYYGEISHIDLYYQVRSKMSLNRNSLAQATEFLEISGKTHLNFSYWGLAAMSDKKSMEKLVEHNTADVEILEDLHYRLEPYCKSTKKSL